MKVRKTYAVCPYCRKPILPWVDDDCIELGFDDYAHQDCCQGKIKESTLPDELKDLAEDLILYGDFKVKTPEWEEDGSDEAYESQF